MVNLAINTFGSRCDGGAPAPNVSTANVLDWTEASAVPAAAVAATVQLLAAVDIAMVEPTPPWAWENFTSWLSPE